MERHQQDRHLPLKVWGGDPLKCPCCKGTMQPVRKAIRREEIEFFLRLHGLWEGVGKASLPFRAAGDVPRQGIRVKETHSFPQSGSIPGRGDRR